MDSIGGNADAVNAVHIAYIASMRLKPAANPSKVAPQSVPGMQYLEIEPV